jgi:hypothetical protein
MASATGRTLARSRDLDFLWNCIQLIATKAHVETIRYLLKMRWGCDIQAFNNDIDSGSTEVVQMFIDKDPSLIAYVGSHNKTCLDVALNGYMPWEKTVPMLRLLLANSADPSKLTPLMWKAVSSSYPEAVEELEYTRRSRWKWTSCVQPYTGLSRDGTSFG